MMKYSAELKVSGNPKRILELFNSELEREPNKRASVKVETSGETIVFKVEASDSVALRAHLLGLTKLLSVIEEMDKV